MYIIYIYSGSLSDISSGILSGGYGPAAPTAIGCFRLRSGPTHCDSELARREEQEEKKEEMEEEKQHLIKSNNPHLAGGEHTYVLTSPRLTHLAPACLQ